MDTAAPLEYWPQTEGSQVTCKSAAIRTEGARRKRMVQESAHKSTKMPSRYPNLEAGVKLALLFITMAVLQIHSDIINQVEAQTSLLSSLYLPNYLPSSNILRRDVNAKQEPKNRPNVCQVNGAENVAIVEIEESRLSDMTQSTNPVELPISGGANEIELKIELETHKYFKIQDKRLRLTRPLDRDAVLRENSSQIQQQPISSIYLQISCLDKRQQDEHQASKQARKVIIPVLVKVLDINDNAPKFTAPVYTASVNELTAVDSIVLDQIQAIDLDSASNGLVEYSLLSPTVPVRSATVREPPRLFQRDRSTMGPTQAELGATNVSGAQPIIVQTIPVQVTTTVATPTMTATDNRSGPTINLNNEPIVNGPMELSEDEETDEALLASFNSTEHDAGPDENSPLAKLLALKSRQKRQTKRVNEPEEVSEGVVSVKADRPKDLWTNLLSSVDELAQMQLLDLSSTNNLNQDSSEYFALEMAPNSNRPLLKLKKQLDYESKRIHVITIMATDKANNKLDRLSSSATIVIKVLDGDDQGPAFVIDQTGCATGSVPTSTTSSLGSIQSTTKPASESAEQLTTIAKISETTTQRPFVHLPKGFKVRDENFEFGDMSSGDDSDGTDLESFSHPGRTLRASGSQSTPSSQQGATRSYQLDYSCLSLTGAQSGQAEYFATVMSADTDYLLRVSPQTIKARDRDQLNAPIRYSFLKGTPANYSQFFQINPLDATIKQVAPVERSQTGRFEIWVEAQEQTNKRLSSLAKLTIEVVPSDKNPPVIVPSSYSGFIDENAPVGSSVFIVPEVEGRNYSTLLRINVLDADYSLPGAPPSTRNAQLYEFETTSDAFKVNKDGFVYVNRSPLDRDPPSQAVHMFQVTARQIGLTASSRSVSSPVSINVTLLDLNDNPPVIVNGSLVPVQIVASNQGSRLVTTIRATDKDLPENGKMRFAIRHVSNNGRERFRINEQTGELEALGKFSAGEQFSLTVEVSDDLARSSQAIYELQVVPGPNTGGPQFVVDSESDNSRGYSVEINESVAPHSAVIQVRAVDPENDPIAYSIVDGNVNNDFYINSRTGIIYVNNKLDREEVGAYVLLVQARDSGGLATNRPVTITISDNNDQNPTFSLPQYLFSVNEGVSDRVIGRVLATDSDAGENGQLSYRLESSPGAQLESGRPLFAIDEQTGDIRVLESLDYERAKSHALLVTARDHGENPRSSTTSVLVRVLDVQDEFPYFERYYLEARLAENLEHHRVAQVQARDPDSQAQITYVIKAGDTSLFQVDPQTGVVSTKRGLDYEESKAHTLFIGTLEHQEADLEDVSSLLAGSLASSLILERSPVCRIDVSVIDTNDNAPRFLDHQMPVRIQDTAQLGSVVTRLLADDLDGSEPNNQLRYELVLGNQGTSTSERCAQSFMIDSTSGAISVKSDLRRDSQSECQLVVRVRDLGVQPHSMNTMTTLTVFIDHIAELSPSSMIGFADNTFTVELDENSPSNCLVKILPVINKPKMSFPLSCEIVSGNDQGRFYVRDNEQRDCELRTRDNMIDYELKQRYTLTVRLNTIGTGSKQTITQVNIKVLDRNDNQPSFHQPSRYIHLTQNRFLAAIASDAPSETQVLQLRAFDADSAHSNGLISYELLNESELEGRFKVDPIDGIVRTSRPVEDLPSTRLPVKLKVMARDNPEAAGDSLSSVAEIVLNLIDDRHRIALVIKDSTAGRVLDSKEEILSAIQERTGLISGLEKAESMKIQRNGTLEPDVTGTDFWFYLIEPGTCRIVSNEDPRVRNALFDQRSYSSLADIIGQNLGFADVRVRLSYSVSGQSGRTLGVSPYRSLAAGNNFTSSIIIFALFIAIAGAIVLVYLCGSWSGYYSHAAKEKLQYLHPGANQFYGHTVGQQSMLNGLQDNYVIGSAYSSLARQQANLMPQVVGRPKQLACRLEPDYQTHLSASKEYETQMLKMSVLFDDSNSVDDQNLNENYFSKNLNM